MIKDIGPALSQILVKKADKKENILDKFSYEHKG